MTSVLPEEESRAVKLKQKLMNDVRGKEEARSFLSFSRENLSISQSELEQGFNKQWFRPRRHTLLSVLAIAIAVLCLGLETWKLRCSLTNARQIEELKRDVETLKHRFLEQDLLDELKAFEEQLYAGEPSDEDDDDDDEDDDSGEADIGNADYDIAYDVDDDGAGSTSTERHAFSSPSNEAGSFFLLPPPKFAARPSEFPDYPSTIAPVPSPTQPPSADKAMMKLLTAVRKAEAKHGQDSTASTRDGGHRNPEKGHSLEEQDGKKSSEQKGEQPKISTKQKRDVPGSKEAIPRKKLGRKRYIRARHSSKRHYAHSAMGNQQDPNAQSLVETQSTEPAQSLEMSGHALAAHYSADSRLPGVSDCRHRCRNCNLTAVGQCHRDRIFTAWRATGWMHGALMQHFHMQNDGSLIIHNNGLYLVYAQIHYVDTVHAAGFRLEVNDRVILQCSVARTGTKIDQSCFSAQVTLLRKNDSLTLKEIEESPRGAILEDIDSFFGVVKLGDIP
ncbi:TNF superfamily member 12 eiger [Megalopta genalis]|uniref:TNF superfamily member 12 eiger n=1 Tax=Megalopta genalis TaxID=115081 RepID=UPI003FD20B8E